jgi:hypothetical protein
MGQLRRSSRAGVVRSYCSGNLPSWVPERAHKPGYTLKPHGDSRVSRGRVGGSPRGHLVKRFCSSGGLRAAAPRPAWRYDSEEGS